MVKMRVKRNDRGWRVGDSHHNAELTDHEVETIRRLCAGDKSQTEVGALFGVSEGYVSKLVRFKARLGLTPREREIARQMLATGADTAAVAAALGVPLEQAHALCEAEAAGVQRLATAMRVMPATRFP